MTPRPSGARRIRWSIDDLGLAEEQLGILLLELDQLAQQHAGGGRRQAADGLQLGLALVAGEVGEQVDEVDQVEQRQALLVGVVEDQRQRRRLGLVGAEHLGQQLRAERAEAGPDRDARALAAERPELHGGAGGRVGRAGARRCGP